MARGDHIFVHCLGYSHHGIDLGNGRVIHFDFHPWQSLTRKLAKTREPKICEADISEFAQGRPLVVRNYPTCDDVGVVIERAESRLADKGYHLFNNNCEHFAIWCKTGKSHSTQVHDLVNAARPIAGGLPTAAVLMKTAGRLPGRLRAVAYGAAFAMTAGAFAARYLENRLRRARRRES